TTSTSGLYRRTSAITSATCRTSLKTGSAVKTRADMGSDSPLRLLHVVRAPGLPMRGDPAQGQAILGVAQGKSTRGRWALPPKDLRRRTVSRLGGEDVIQDPPPAADLFGPNRQLLAHQRGAVGDAINLHVFARSHFQDLRAHATTVRNAQVAAEADFVRGAIDQSLFDLQFVRRVDVAEDSQKDVAGPEFDLAIDAELVAAVGRNIEGEAQRLRSATRRRRKGQLQLLSQLRLGGELDFELVGFGAPTARGQHAHLAVGGMIETVAQTQDDRVRRAEDAGQLRLVEHDRHLPTHQFLVRAQNERRKRTDLDAPSRFVGDGFDLSAPGVDLANVMAQVDRLFSGRTVPNHDDGLLAADEDPVLAALRQLQTPRVFRPRQRQRRGAPGQQQFGRRALG